MAETVKVIVRCRPMNTREKDLKCLEVVNMDTKVCACSITNPADKKAIPKRFTFDGAYGTDSTTEQIYNDIGFPLVEGVCEGYNGTIFAYGQTGCGKSFSMQGITDPATQRGIIPRAFDHIFETIQVAEDTKYLVHASYLEIYNEEIRDLLGKDTKKKLDLKEHPDKGVYCAGLSMHPCTNVNECNKIMKRGWDNRSTGATLMNADSSRSHSIFSIYMERIDSDEKGEEHIRAAKLNLVDLAGSERQGKTGATGDRLKEATKINLSLSALGNVISALVDGKAKHIPYRDSKLTRLLQDSLGGNTKTLMVACLSPADNNYDETLSTLRYANRAKNIKNKPKINEDPKDALLREYQDEIQRLKAMLRGEIPMELEEGESRASAPKPAAARAPRHDAETEDEQVQHIKQEYEDKMAAMQQEFEEMKISRDKMEEEMAVLRQDYEGKMSAVGVAHVTSPGQSGAELMSIGSNEFGSEDGGPSIQEQVIQHAVHLATVKTVGDQGAVVAPLTPSTSPTGQHQATMSGHAISTDEAMKKARTNSAEIPQKAKKRLQALQKQMVGGEEATNEEVKERHKKKKKHVEERKRRLAEALANMEGEDIMLDIYDNIQDQLKAATRALKREKDKNEAMQREIKDLQAEFEFDRIDYLDTIRKQEQEMMWKQEVINRVHPCLRRDCNYTNLDKIRAQSRWDEESQAWIMPKLVIDKTKLPGAPGARVDLPPTGGRAQVNGVSDEALEDLRSESKYLQKLNQRPDESMNYFKSQRQEKLLNSRSIVNGTRSPQNGLSNGHLPPAAPWQNEPLSHDQLRAAQVHGQISSEDFPVRKPTRLNALPLQPPQTAGKKRGKKKANMMEMY